MTDIELVDQSARGDRQAFGRLVERYQSLVCAVAYSIVGDFARSEDVAQEAFLTAWTKLSDLRERSKFASWISGIARNMALVDVRQQRKLQPLDPDVPNASLQPSPPEIAAAREEEALVWHTLETLPETYREPLVLFYREQNSVARVADALDLSEDAVKQRLSRGREMLREEIAATIERTLRRTAPKAVFALAVLGALPGIGAATASAATIVAGGKATAGPLAAPIAASSAGPILFGTGFGLLGQLIGLWFADQSTRYPRERALFRRGALIWLLADCVIFPAPFAAIAAGWWNPVQMFGPVVYGPVLVAWIMTFLIGQVLWIWRVVHQMRRSVAEDIASRAKPLTSGPFRRLIASYRKRGEQFERLVARFGRERVVARFQRTHGSSSWTSRWTLYGLPLIDIQSARYPKLDTSWESLSGLSQLRDIAEIVNSLRRFVKSFLTKSGTAQSDENRPDSSAFPFGFRPDPRRPIARGWIAIGDRACGLIAIGNVTVGGIAIGGTCTGGLTLGGFGLGVVSLSGLSVGLFAVGGIAVGGAALGGLSLGLLSAGGLALGGLALGGFAVGWFAFGGYAVGWQALGGVAIAWRAANGGMAIAHDYAVGQPARAAHANDAAAIAFMKESQFFQFVEVAMRNPDEFMEKYQTLLIAVPVGLCLTVLLGVILVVRSRFIRHESGENG